MVGAKDHIIKVNFKIEQKINMNDRFETNRKMKVELFDNELTEMVEISGAKLPWETLSVC